VRHSSFIRTMFKKVVDANDDTKPIIKHDAASINIQEQHTEPAADRSRERRVHDERRFNYKHAFFVLTMVNLISPLLGFAQITFFVKSGWWLGVVYIVSGSWAFGILRWATLGDEKDLPLVQLRICFMTYVQIIVLTYFSALFAFTPRIEFGLCCPTSNVDGVAACCDAAEMESHLWAWSCLFIVLAGMLPSSIVIHTWANTQEIVTFRKDDVTAED